MESRDDRRDELYERAQWEYSICQNCVLPDCSRHHPKCLMRKKRKTSPQQEQAAELYRAGKTIQEIADAMCTTRNNIYTHLSHAGISYHAHIGRPRKEV